MMLQELTTDEVKVFTAVMLTTQDTGSLLRHYKMPPEARQNEDA